MTLTPVLQLSDAPAFERGLTRAILAGAIAGIARTLAAFVGLAWPLGLVVALALCFAEAKGDRWDRSLIRALALLAVGGAALFSVQWGEGVAGASAGVLLMLARRRSLGAAGLVDREQLSVFNYGLGALLGALLCWLGMGIASALGARALALGVPALVVETLAGATGGLFLGFAQVAGHVVLRANPVEALAREQLPQLSGELEKLARRAVAAYRGCAASLKDLPSQAEREELAQTLSELTWDALHLAGDWARVQRDLDTLTQARATQETVQLEEAAAHTLDPLSRAHFQLAVATLREEHALVEDLQRRREQMVAKLWSQTTLLERARTSLIGARTGEIHLKAAELSGLAQKLAAMSHAQGMDGALAAEAVTRAELGVVA